MHVYKIGGNELNDPGFLDTLATAVSQAAEPVVIVHGGGRAIAGLQAQLGLKTEKVDGLRITDRESLLAAEMVLSGQANKMIVKALLAAGVDAIGISGVDGGVLRCQKKSHPTADLGYVGQIDAVRTDLLHGLMRQGLTIVLSPISLGWDGCTYNVNADEAASAVAGAMQADLLNFISNVPGVLANGRILPQLTIHETEQLIANGIITDGMVPKVRSALEAIGQGVSQARIVNLTGLLQDGGTRFH